MAGFRCPFTPRRAAAVLTTAYVFGCGDATAPEQQGPLVLTITAPDSVVTKVLPGSGGNAEYSCVLSQTAELSGGGSDGVIHWQAAEITWRWLSNNELKHSAVWSVTSLVLFWGSFQLKSGETRQSQLWEFSGTMPFRLDFVFHYRIPSEDTVRTQETAVRCVGPR